MDWARAYADGSSIYTVNNVPAMSLDMGYLGFDLSYQRYDYVTSSQHCPFFLCYLVLLECFWNPVLPRVSHE